MTRPFTSLLFAAGLSLAAVAPAGAQAMGAPGPMGMPPGGMHGGPPGILPPGGPTIRAAGLVAASANVAYAPASPTQKLDVYLPKGATGPVPAVIYAHPGGFRFGDKSMASAAIADGILAGGFAFIPINYRLSGEAPFPAAVQDLFAAIEYVKSHAETLGVDPARIVVYGESAGANLASLAGVAYDEPLFRRSLVDPKADLRPQGVIALYPPVDFLQIDGMLEAQGCPAQPMMAHAAAGSMESLYLGAALGNVPDLVRQANPGTYAKPTPPRFLVENGNKDCNVGNGQAPILVDALHKAGAKVEYDVLDGAGHGGLPFESAVNVARIVSFLRTVESGPVR